jgi:ankyrin repeat protein
MVLSRYVVLGIIGWSLCAAPVHAQGVEAAPPAPAIEATADITSVDVAAETVTNAASNVVPKIIPDVNARNEIIYRANLGRADDVALLIEQGGSPNQLTGEGVPILCLASARKDAEGKKVVEMLLAKGADISVRDRKGQTALFYAAKVGNIEVINYLLEHKIDLYAIDNNGDVARTVAFAAGRKESVLAMDAFVTRPATQAEKALSTTDPVVDPVPPIMPITPVTQPADKVIEEMKSNPLSREEMKRVSEEISQENKKAQSQSDSTVASAKTAQNNEAEAQKKQIALERISSDIAFNTCGFQYWSYCKQVKQTTELQSEELTVAIVAFRSKVDELKKQIFAEHAIDAAYYNNLTASAQRRIFNQLDTMKSNRERREQSVGRMDDMRERCGEIGRQWMVEVPPLAKPRKSKNQDSDRQPQDRVNNQSSQGSGGYSGSTSSGGGAAPMLRPGNNNNSPSNAPPLQEQQSYPQFK